MGKAKKTIGTEKPVYKRERVAMTDADRVNNQPYDIDVIPEPEHPSTRSKVANYLVIGALAVIAIALGILLYWASASEQILEVKNEPFPVRTIREHPTAGGVVFIKVDLCKNTDIEGKTRISFVSKSREIFLPQSHEEMDEGCFVREIPILLPLDIPADTYKVKFRLEYKLNPLKQQVVDEFESKEFAVDPVTR